MEEVKTKEDNRAKRIVVWGKKKADELKAKEIEDAVPSTHPTNCQVQPSFAPVLLNP